MDLSRSDVVRCLAGRDAGTLFFIADSDGVYVSLVDGKHRTLEKPKRKKIRHVQLVLRPDSPIAEKLRSGEKLLNSELRRELAAISRNINVSTKEVRKTWQKTT